MSAGNSSPTANALLLILLILCLVFTGCGLGNGTTKLATSTKPVLSVSPTSMTFGNVNTGATKAQALLLRNTGGSALTVTSLTVAGTGFTVTGFKLPLTIAPGGNVAGSVTFAPQAGGSVTGSITVVSNSSVAVAPVALSGAGVAQTPQLALTPTSISFGNVTMGQQSSKQLTIRNSGTADLHVSSLTAAGAGFTTNGFILPLTLAPGTTAVGNVVFAPGVAGATTGSITVASDSATAVPPVALTGTGLAATPQISISPTTLVFGNVTTGQSGTTPITLTNSGTGNLNITAVTVTGTGYRVNGFILPLTLVSGASATGNVVFAPQATGVANGNLAVTSNASNTAPTVSMTGTGVAPQTYQMAVSPASLSFGTVTAGATSSLNVTLSNTGTGSLSVTAANVTGGGFSVSGTYPMTITAGGTRTVAVTFAPPLAGAATGSVAFVSNATNSPVTVSLSGTGEAGVQHSVDLVWTASTSAVVGYNVYRSTVSGGPYTLLTGAPVASTNYTDWTVVSGQTYYYVIRSVDASGVESVNSPQAVAVIP